MDFQSARFSMVDRQIRTNRVSNARVCDAFRAVPREMFLPRSAQAQAYLDQDVALANGRFLLQPLVAARLLDAAAVRDSDVAMVIGDATGWLAAVLSRLASTVVVLDAGGETGARVGALLAEQGCDTVAVVRGSAAEGYPAQAPYDVIVYAGAVAEVPAVVQRQLSDGGRLVAVIRAEEGRPGVGTRLVRAGDTFGRRALFEAATPFLSGLGPKPVFRL